MLGWTIRLRFGGMESALLYLQKMAANGWMLKYWQGNTLLFQRTEPGRLRFAMDIIPIGRWKLDGGRDNEEVREEFVAMYEEQGWHFIEHHERKFLFYTEDESLPLPQTDPVAYRDSVYRHHRNTTMLFVVLAVLSGLFLSYMWHGLYAFVTSAIGTGLLQLILVLLGYCVCGVLQNSIPMMRESRSLKQGIVPQIRRNELFGWMMATCLVITMIGTSKMAVLHMGKQTRPYLFVILCMIFQWGAINIGPWMLSVLTKLPWGKIKKYAYQTARVLQICATLSLVFATDIENQSMEMKWTQDTIPLFTLEEVYGVEEKLSKRTYEYGVAEEYHYIGGNYEYQISYKLVVSSWKAVRRSFERNPDFYAYFFWPNGINFEDQWREYRVDLDAESLGVNIAWQVNYPDAIPYRYYLETDTAGLYITSQHEIGAEWMQKIAERLREVK